MTEVEHCRWCAGEASDARACTCPHDCGISGCPQRAAMPDDTLDEHQGGDPCDYDDDEPCSHDHDEECYDYQGFYACSHSHCFNCGGCNCPGYCDDYQTYNLRPSETGGTA